MDKAKLKSTEKTEIIPEPKGPMKRPKNPLQTEENRGKKMRLRYMFFKI